MKTTKDKVYSKLAAARTNLKSNKVALGLVDELDYEFDTLNEEVSRLSYVVDEWFDEKYDTWYQIGREIYDVYFNNSESFFTPDDLVDDLEKLNSIKEKAEELGIDVNDVYPNWEEHTREIRFLTEQSDLFEEQKQRFADESRSI
jgi:hypothetical protein